MNNMEKLVGSIVADSEDFKKEICRIQKSGTFGIVKKIILTFLHCQGVVYPSKLCFCSHDVESATDDEVRAFYTAIFSALRVFGFNDMELRELVATHKEARSLSIHVVNGYYEEVKHDIDVIDVEVWVLTRYQVCGFCYIDTWAEMVANYLTDKYSK